MYGSDYKANTCGMDSMKNQKFTVYPRVNEVGSSARVCVDNTAKSTQQTTEKVYFEFDGDVAPPCVCRLQDFLINIAKSNPLDYKFYGICVSTCPGSLDVV